MTDEYSELCMFILRNPIPEPELRVAEFECVPIWNITELLGGATTHSPLTFALSEKGERVFEPVLDDIVSMLYFHGNIRYQAVCIVEYKAQDHDYENLEVTSVIPLSDGMVSTIHGFVFDKEFVLWQ